MSRKRAAIGGILALVYPGLGHVYLRAWTRAITWFGLALLTAALVVPDSVLLAFERGGIDALIEASADMPADAVLALAAVRLLNALDAAWIGFRSSSRKHGDHEGPTCPNCGSELDPDIEFCPWCTTYTGGRSGADGE